MVINALASRRSNRWCDRFLGVCAARIVSVQLSNPDHSIDPRHVFLDATAVMRRYGWGRTKGYQNLKNRELVPSPMMTHPDRWRLDQLLTQEERLISAAELHSVEESVAGTSLTPLAARLPPPKRVRRRSA
jgi:hypothetical protein